MQRRGRDPNAVDRHHRYGPDSGDEPWSSSPWLWYFAPAPIILVVAGMIFIDGFLVVGGATPSSSGSAAYAWHELGEW